MLYVEYLFKRLSFVHRLIYYTYTNKTLNIVCVNYTYNYKLKQQKKTNLNFVYMKTVYRT